MFDTDDHSSKYRWPTLVKFESIAEANSSFSAPLRLQGRWQWDQRSFSYRGALNEPERPCRVQTPWAQISCLLSYLL